MASIAYEGDRARIMFRDTDGKQKSLRLGKVSKQDARQAASAIELLLEAKEYTRTPAAEALAWLEAIGPRLHARVVRLELAAPRVSAESVTVGGLLERFEATMTVQPTTRYKYRQVMDSLRAFLGAATPLASIAPAHADDWRKSIAEAKADPADKDKKPKTPARATIAKRVVIARGVFGKAVRWGLIPSNPFADLRAGSQSNPDRAFYVSPESIRAIMAACADDQWRAIVALSRFAGLRCPSEIVGLRWGDVNWERGRLMVRSPKTAGHEGHAVRVVPIATELRPILQALFDAAEDGSVAVVPRLRDPSMNLRTQFERIIAKAGLKPWPRLFHNMRASCATDWVERFPAHVVAGWLGHSPMIAAQHYLQTRDAHFDLAAGVGETAENPATNGATNPATNPATQARPTAHPGDQSDGDNDRTDGEKPEESAVLVGVGAEYDTVRKAPNKQGMPPEGSELPSVSAGISHDSPESGNKSGNTSATNGGSPSPATPTDPDLLAVVAAWPDLPPAIRAGVLALVKAGMPAPAADPKAGAKA